MRAEDRKVILVTRRTRLAELIARYHTLAQARFYIEHLGADFADYVREDEAYASSLQTVTEALREYIARREQATIVELFGKVDVDPSYDYKERRRRR